MTTNENPSDPMMEAARGLFGQANKAPAPDVEQEAPKPAPSTEQALRNRIAAKHGIAEDVRDLFLIGDDATSLERTAAALAAQGLAGTPKQPGPYVPTEGKTTGDAPRYDDTHEFARRLFGRRD